MSDPSKLLEALEAAAKANGLVFDRTRAYVSLEVLHGSQPVNHQMALVPLLESKSSEVVIAADIVSAVSAVIRASQQAADPLAMFAENAELKRKLAAAGIP